MQCLWELYKRKFFLCISVFLFGSCDILSAIEQSLEQSFIFCCVTALLEAICLSVLFFLMLFVCKAITSKKTMVNDSRSL